MRIKSLRAVGRTTLCVMLFFVLAGSLPLFAQAGSPSGPATAAPDQSDLPDSPSAILAKGQTPTFQQSAAQENSTQARADQPAENPAPQGVSTSTSSASSAQQTTQSSQPPQQKPVGTAAAEPTHANGIAASQPAGVAVSPVKQRRTRTIIIRTAALIGAGVAVGTVVALTAATSSRPPGAH